MKLDPTSSEKLKSDLRERVKARGLTYSEISERARVHSSQVSRICRGEFRTLSHNVVQICKTLGIEVEMVKLEGTAEDKLAQRLERSVLKLWDRTPADAERLVRFLHLLSELRRAARSDAS